MTVSIRKKKMERWVVPQKFAKKSQEKLHKRKSSGKIKLNGLNSLLITYEE